MWEWIIAILVFASVLSWVGVFVAITTFRNRVAGEVERGLEDLLRKMDDRIQRRLERASQQPSDRSPTPRQSLEESSTILPARDIDGPLLPPGISAGQSLEPYLEEGRLH